MINIRICIHYSHTNIGVLNKKKNNGIAPIFVNDFKLTLRCLAWKSSRHIFSVFVIVYEANDDYLLAFASMRVFDDGFLLDDEEVNFT